LASLLIQDHDWGSKDGDTRNQEVTGKGKRDNTFVAIQGKGNQ